MLKGFSPTIQVPVAALPLSARDLSQLVESAALLTLPSQNVALAEWFNFDEGNGTDENIKSVLHARIQARSGRAP